MARWNLSRYAFGLSAAASLLSAWGGSQPQIEARRSARGIGAIAAGRASTRVSATRRGSSARSRRGSMRFRSRRSRQRRDCRSQPARGFELVRRSASAALGSVDGARGKLTITLVSGEPLSPVEDSTSRLDRSRRWSHESTFLPVALYKRGGGTAGVLHGSADRYAFGISACDSRSCKPGPARNALVDTPQGEERNARVRESW